jgi:uncharacterized protein DUF6928
MGAKTTLLAFSDGDLRPALLGATRPSVDEVAEAVRAVLPGYDVTPTEGDGSLFDHVNPPDDTTYATVLAGAELFADRRLAYDRPSELPAHLLALGKGRRIVLHGMHSVNDWLSFAVWEDGELVRSLSLSPDSGIIEDLGPHLEFERPFWAGEHREDDYPLPFHPLELGEEALRALFGFVIEGYPDDSDVDAETVPMIGFRVVDPSGQEQAERDAAYQAFRERMGTPRFFRPGPDGEMVEVTIDNLL